MEENSLGMTTDFSTIDIALKTLDAQYNKIWSTRIGKQRDSQMAYYNGMKQMIDILVSNAFKNDTKVDCDMSGTHYLVGIDWGEKENS